MMQTDRGERGERDGTEEGSETLSDLAPQGTEPRRDAGYEFVDGGAILVVD